MCIHCQNPVTVESVKTVLAEFGALLLMLGFKPDVNTGIALRMIARQSQSQEWHDCLDAVDSGEKTENDVQSLERSFFAQASDFSRSFTDSGQNFDETYATYTRIVGLLARAKVPVDNDLSAALLALSELMFTCPDGPETTDIDSAVETNVLLFNAEKAATRDGQNFFLN